MSEYGDGDNYCVVNETDTRKARKSHRCSACHEIITPGRTYTRVFLIGSDSGPDWAKRCERCQAIYEHLSDKMVGIDDEFCNWELACGHEYKERWGEDPPPEIAALAFWLPGDPLPVAAHK